MTARRRLATALAGSQRLRSVAESAGLRHLVSQYVAGGTPTDAARVVSSLRRRGVAASVAWLREPATDLVMAAAAEAVTAAGASTISVTMRSSTSPRAISDSSEDEHPAAASAVASTPITTASSRNPRRGCGRAGADDVPPVPPTLTAPS